MYRLNLTVVSHSRYILRQDSAARTVFLLPGPGEQQVRQLDRPIRNRPPVGAKWQSVSPVGIVTRVVGLGVEGALGRSGY